MSDGSRHSVWAIPEVDYAVLPATPAYEKVRYNTCTIGLTRDTLQSAEIRSDRQIADFRMGQNKVGGNLTGEMSLDDTLMGFLEAVMGGTWTEKVLKSGLVRRSFSLLRHFEDMASTKPWFLIPGIEFSAFSLSVEPGKIATYTLDTIGQGFTAATSAPTGSTFGTPSTNSPMDAFTGAISEGGTAIAAVTQVSLKLDNGMNRKFVIGSRNTLRPEEGRSNCTGSMTAYFENTTLLEKFMNDSNSSLSFQLTAGSDTLTFALPNLKYTTGQPDVSGEGAVTVPMNFQAIYSPADATQLVITRS